MYSNVIIINQLIIVRRLKQSHASNYRARVEFQSIKWVSHRRQLHDNLNEIKL